MNAVASQIFAMNFSHLQILFYNFNLEFLSLSSLNRDLGAGSVDLQPIKVPRKNIATGVRAFLLDSLFKDFTFLY